MTLCVGIIAGLLSYPDLHMNEVINVDSVIFTAPSMSKKTSLTDVGHSVLLTR